MAGDHSSATLASLSYHVYDTGLVTESELTEGYSVRNCSADMSHPGGSPTKIATAVGFDTAATFRNHFRQAMHTSPAAYRRTFHGRAIGASSTRPPDRTRT